MPRFTMTQRDFVINKLMEVWVKNNAEPVLDVAALAAEIAPQLLEIAEVKLSSVVHKEGLSNLLEGGHSTSNLNIHVEPTDKKCSTKQIHTLQLSCEDFPQLKKLLPLYPDSTLFRVMLLTGYTSLNLVFPAKSSVITSIEKYQRNLEKYKEKCGQMRHDIAASLSNYNTHLQLRNNWPEAAVYLDEIVKGKRSTALTVPVSLLNAEIGLPDSENKDKPTSGK